MLLSELSLIEVTNLRTEFRQTDAHEGSGEVNFLFGSLTFEVGAKLIADESKSVIIIQANPKAIALRDDKVTEEFSLDIAMRMVYTYPSSEVVDENFIKDNSWYFSSFLRTYFKVFADNILKQAGINGIALPFN